MPRPMESQNGKLLLAIIISSVVTSLLTTGGVLYVIQQNKLSHVDNAVIPTVKTDIVTTTTPSVPAEAEKMAPTSNAKGEAILYRDQEKGLQIVTSQACKDEIAVKQSGSSLEVVFTKTTSWGKPGTGWFMYGVFTKAGYEAFHKDDPMNYEAKILGADTYVIQSGPHDPADAPIEGCYSSVKIEKI